MTSLLRMPDDELTRRNSAGDSLRLLSAAGLGTLATVLALLGMAARFGPDDVAPLPGMNHPAGQAAWAVLLGAMILLAGVLAESVVVRRLQKAVIISLAIHLLLCLFSLLVHLHGTPIAAVEAEEDGAASLSELTIPDYGGLESPSADTPDFNAPAQVDLTADAAAELERQMTEVDAQAAPQEVTVEQSREVARLENMQRRTEEAMRQETPMQIERQSRENAAATPQQVSNPQVNTQASQQPELTARDADRADAALAQTRREVTEVRSPNQTQTEASRINVQRTESQPTDMNAASGNPGAASARAAAQAAAADTSAQSVAVATQAVQQPRLSQRSVELQRQAQASAAATQSPMTNSPTVQQTVAAQQVNVQRSDRAAASATPDSVAAARMQRSQASSAQSPSAVSAPAESVQVAAAESAAAAPLSAQQAASTVTRSASGTAAPTGAAAASTSTPSVQRAATGASSLSGSTIRRNGSAGSQPALNSAASGGGTTSASRSGDSAGDSLSAVGSQAQSVSVGAAGSSAADDGSVLVAGPAGGATGVSRNRSALPSRGTGSGAASGGTSAGTGLAMTRGGPAQSGSGVRGLGTSGLTGRGDGPAATLGSSVGTGTTQGGPGRRGASANLPAGMLAAEQSGALVVAGPQAAPTGVGGGGASRAGTGLAGLSGPRSTSVGRRSAGLPGSRPGSTIGRSRPGLPGGLSAGRIAIASAAGGTGSAPAIAGASEIAGLMRRAAPSIGAVNADASSAGFSMRRPDVRREAAEKLGGNGESEDAVERGLNWLASHQFAAGNWSIHELSCGDDCSGHGSFQSDTAATGLALLAFLGAGYTHTSGEHQDVVRRGLDWLTSHQKASGDLFADETRFVWMYSHGMAAIALCEAYGMTGDESLQQPAQRALDFIVAAQHPTFGGWRYRPRFESDTSVSGWQLMALKSGEMAGLTVPQSAYDGVTRWLNSVEESSTPGRFRYHPSKDISLAMTAEGLLMRQYLGATRNDPSLLAGANYLRARAPRIEERDAYYWYYATQVMFHMQGDHWEDWNAKLRDILITGQLKDGHSAGSWNPSRPTTAKWGEAGGRHYLTCLNLLMLEVYYRHLPLYIELDR